MYTYIFKYLYTCIVYNTQIYLLINIVSSTLKDTFFSFGDVFNVNAQFFFFQFNVKLIVLIE